ncbi:MAG: MBL fold metallo-hydrolase [Nitrospinota bacterium]|jgi:cyclase|nr:MBL fold metallo-hydrolase [Nitrospinota bacterium]
MPKTSKLKGKTTTLREIAKGVYVYIGGSGLTNFGLVLTKDKPVVIDSDMRVRKRFIKGMRRVTRKNAGLVFNTHHNFDHTSDNRYHALRGAVTIGSEFTRREMGPEMETKGVAHHLRNGFSLERRAPNLGIDPPMVTFRDRLEIRYGGRLFRIIYFGHCHTKGDSVIWMPEEKILFAGDLIAYRSHTASSQGDFDNWRQALNRLK